MLQEALFRRKDLNVGQGRYIEHPEHAVEGEQRIFIQVIEKDQDQHKKHPCTLLQTAPQQQRPQLFPAAEVTEEKEEQSGQAQLQPYLKKTIVRMKQHEPQGKNDVKR